jgi:hypothetical protein
MLDKQLPWDDPDTAAGEDSEGLLVRALPLAMKVQILNKKANQTFPMVHISYGT